MSDPAQISFQLERALALADCAPAESPVAMGKRLGDLRALLPILRADMDAMLARREQNAHPKARRIARLFDTLQPMMLPDCFTARSKDIHQTLERIDDDWQWFCS